MNRSDLKMMNAHVNSVLDKESYAFYAEPFTGWRCWDVHVDEENERFLLKSITHRVPWEPGEELVADCLGSLFKEPGKIHNSPNLDHGCGIHAVKERGDALAWKLLGRKSGEHHDIKFDTRVYGLVYLWGVVYHFTDGYLAEFAYPKEVFVKNEKRTRLDAKEVQSELSKSYKGTKFNLE